MAIDPKEVEWDKPTIDPSEVEWDSQVFQTTPGGAATGLRLPKGAAASFQGQLLQRQPGIDYSRGVTDFGLRAGLSFMEGEQEKTSFLDQKFGIGNWDKDKFGAYYAKPEGLKKLGIESKVPISLDEQSITRYDLVDVLGDVPAILGATGAGIAATGMGAPAGMALTALGAAGGEAYKELGKNILGYRGRPATEIAKDIGGEAGAAAAGEGVFRLARPVGKFFLGPQQKRMTPEREALSETATKLGFKVRPGQVTDAPLLSRWEGMVKKLFGDLDREPNLKVAQKVMDDLLDTLGQPKGAVQVGTNVRLDIIAARRAFGNEMKKLYTRVDELAGKRQIVPMASVKKTLKEYIDNLPVNQEGERIFPTPELERFVKKYENLADFQTVSATQEMRTAFREAAETPNLVPGVSERQAGLLKKAADEAFDQLKNSTEINQQVRNALSVADDAYRKGIADFDNPVIASLTRDASFSGAVDPDQVVKYIVKPEHSVRLSRVKKLVTPETWAGVQRSHGEDLMKTMTIKTDDPFKTLLSGQNFERTLDSYGRDTLEVLYGKQWVDDAYNFARSVKLVGKTQAMSGGIVAAGIALHPIRNLPKLAYQRALVAFMQQPGTLKWLTVGIRAPKTRAGIDAFARLNTMALALARDETGSSRLLSPEARNPVSLPTETANE